MTEAAKKLGEQARRLTAEDRLQLVDEILASLEQPDAANERLWAKEAEDRLAAYRRGEAKAVELREVLAKYRVK
jgi:putative addiction module component (TIGR02574 family)